MKGPRIDWLPRRNGEIPPSIQSRYGRLLGQLLWSRGWDDPETAESLFDPRLDALSSPFKMQNMDAAAERVARAVRESERICVYADYDIDGMSGLAILVSFLEACGATAPVAYQPDRLAEGYGVHPDAIRAVVEKGACVIVTVDTGIAAFDAAREARQLGVDLIVTDHHQQIGELPDALVINPNQKTDDSGLGYLSGAGVAFYLAIAVRAKLREQGYFNPARPQPDIREWLDLFVLGTLADHVTLQGDNRALVRAGLKQLLRSKRPGLDLLRRRTITRESITARDVVFSLTPKLNAASRMGHAALSTELLLTKDTVRAGQLVEEILLLNQQRSEVQAKVFEEACSQVEASPLDSSVILVHGEWHEGVLGIVAAKLVERFGQPAIVLTQLSHDKTVLRGSMRTKPGVSCIKVLGACQEALLKFGGHEMAAGLQVEASRLEAFRELLRASNDDDSASSGGGHTISFDGPLPLADLEPKRIDAMDDLGPWGSGNPEPLFLMEGIDLTAARILKQQHVKISLPEGHEVIGFFKAAEIEGFRSAGHQKIDALLRPEMNRFRGSETVQLKLEYVRPHQGHDPHP